MKRWMKVLLLTLLAGMVIAGLGSVLPVRAADGEVILYRVNAGGNQVNATDGGPNWARDDANSGSNRSPYYKGDSTQFFSFGAGDLGGPVQGAAPPNVYRMGRQATRCNPTIRYEFPVTPGRTYRINLYFVDPRDDDDYEDDNRDRVFDVQVNGSVPSAFNNITLARIWQGPRWSYRVPVMVTAEVTMPSNDSTLDLVWSRVGQSRSPYPVVSGIEIIELVPQDTTPPTVSITSPANGELVSGTVQITATASDNVGVTEVEFYCGTSSLGKGTLSGGVWQLNWNTTTLADGTCVLTAKARDAATNEGTSAAVNVTIDNTAPTVSITSPTGGYVQGTVQITATASDTNGVKQVEFFVDGTSIGVDTNGADGWSVDWDTTGDVDGWYVLTAKATDDSNNTGESDGVEVLVDNIPTVLEIVRPTSGAPVSGQVEIALSGSPDLMRVEVYLDGEYLDEATLVDGVWTLLWDTTAFEDGVYTLTAYGMTELEQGIESQAMQVTVQNTETPPGDEPTPTVPDVLPAMLCDLDDGSLNAHHCGRPVAIFRSGDELHLYGIDINTGNGSLALLVTAADIESAGVPEDVPVLIAVGENPYTHRPIALYRLPGGEFQLNTAYWDGKEYIVKWQPGAAHVEVIYW